MFKTNAAGSRYLKIVILRKDSKSSCSTPLFILFPNQSQGFKEVLTRVIILYHFVWLRPSKLHWNWHNCNTFQRHSRSNPTWSNNFARPHTWPPKAPFSIRVRPREGWLFVQQTVLFQHFFQTFIIVVRSVWNGRPAEQRLPGRYKVAKARLVANSATRCQLALVGSIAP